MHPVLHYLVFYMCPVFLAFLLGYRTTRIIQRLEWQKQDLQKQIDEIKALESCLMVVKDEMLRNRVSLEQRKKYGESGSRAEALSEMSTLSFQSAWPVFIQSKFVEAVRMPLMKIAILYAVYMTVNRALEFTQDVVSAGTMPWSRMSPAVLEIVKLGLTSAINDDASNALKEIRKELGKRKRELGQKLKRLQRPWWKFRAGAKRSSERAQYGEGVK